MYVFFFQAEDGIRDLVRSRGLGDVYKRQGYTTVKMKIGAIGIEDELELLRAVRKEHGPKELTLRVDANGAFSMKNVPEILEQLAELDVHSICLLYTSPSPRDRTRSRMPSSA